MVGGIHLDTRGQAMFHRYLSKLKVSNVDRYDRFVAVRQQIGALDNTKNFERAFQKAFKSAFAEVGRSGQTGRCARRVPPLRGEI
jgi:hypothetical protein